MTDVPLWRLYLLRTTYLIVATGLGVEVWPGIVHHVRPWQLMQGVVSCVLGAVGLLAVLGLRYPLQMIPLLLFELAWKSIWLGVVALPLWSAGTMDADTWDTASACLMGVIFLVAILWRYVVANYVLKRGDRWR